jgi:curved DNA-binding protein CbpA
MPKKKKSDYAPHTEPEHAKPCQIGGCAEAGVYKAPKSREELHNYQWFCLEHVRQHNQKWDFFAEMDSDDIEHFIRDSVHGHRPTWARESHLRNASQQLHEALYAFLHGDRQVKKPLPPLSAKLRKALSAFDMDYPYTAEALKIQYRALVKKHHPDVNKGDKKSEETFKKITAAYHVLSEHLKA